MASPLIFDRLSKKSVHVIKAKHVSIEFEINSPRILIDKFFPNHKILSINLKMVTNINFIKLIVLLNQESEPFGSKKKIYFFK